MPLLPAQPFTRRQRTLRLKGCAGFPGHRTQRVGEPDFLTVQGDIAEPKTAQRVVEQTLGRFGRIDTLVNNAGALIGKPLTDYALDDYAAVTAVNAVADAILSRSRRRSAERCARLRSAGRRRSRAAGAPRCASPRARRLQPRAPQPDRAPSAGRSLLSGPPWSAAAGRCAGVTHLRGRVVVPLSGVTTRCAFIQKAVLCGLRRDQLGVDNGSGRALGSPTGALPVTGSCERLN
jgi:NAD(P)-dependent dehydrogenase (short-subunit alcohol dehydrogenase family)